MLVVLTTAELLAVRPGSGWRGDVLVCLAYAGGACAGAAMFGMRAVVVSHSTLSEDAAAFEVAIVELIRLRRLLQRLSSAFGALVALSTLALGAGVLLGKNQPRELIVLFGGAGSALVGGLLRAAPECNPN